MYKYIGRLHICTIIRWQKLLEGEAGAFRKPKNFQRRGSLSLCLISSTSIYLYLRGVIMYEVHMYKYEVRVLHRCFVPRTWTRHCDRYYVLRVLWTYHMIRICRMLPDSKYLVHRCTKCTYTLYKYYVPRTMYICTSSVSMSCLVKYIRT